jgi:glutamate dehydrogenase (NAD(P)+)
VPTLQPHLHKLTGTDGFVVFDLEHAERSAGIVRAAPKILLDGATWLARSMTYQFASFEVRAGGASAGVNTPPAGRDEAVAAFVEEVGPLVGDGRLVLDPGKGVVEADLAPLAPIDPRPPVCRVERHQLTARSVVLAAEAALGGSLEGRTVAIEGFDAAADALVAEVAERGGRVVAVATSEGMVEDTAGFDPARLALSHAEHGPSFVAQLGLDTHKTQLVLGREVDVLFVGSRAGVVDHNGAGYVRARVLVPNGPVPVTAKALAVLRRAGIEVLPDFVTLAGPTIAGLLGPAATAESARAAIAEQVPAVLRDVLDHPDGALLGACHRAEAFLRTWCEALPFGRPLA